MMIIKGTLSSVWDVDGKRRGYVIETPCDIDLETGLVDAESASDDESASVSMLDRQYITFAGKEFPCCEWESSQDCRALDVESLRSYAIEVCTIKKSDKPKI